MYEVHLGGCGKRVGGNYRPGGAFSAGFEVDNLSLLRGSWVQCRLRMSARCIDRLLKQVRLTAIPHDRAQEA